MDRLKRAALLTQLIEQLRTAGSWCGETHVQKAALFLQELMGVPFGFEFILYKHGPFSFDLRDELTGLRADGLITLEAQWPYGPRIVPTGQSRYIRQLSSKTLANYERSIAFVTTKLGNKGVADLERFATAFYVTKHGRDGASVRERAGSLTELKPHIPLDSSLAAVHEVDGIIQEARAHTSHNRAYFMPDLAGVDSV